MSGAAAAPAGGLRKLRLAERCRAHLRAAKVYGITPLAILGVALFVTIFDNSSLFRNVLRATLVDERQVAIVFSLFVLVAGSLVIPLAFAGGIRLFKIAAAALLILAAICGYFMSEYGIVVDLSMIRNIVETDVREATPLVTSDFLRHLAIFGMAPAVIVALLPLPRIGWRRDLLVRGGMILVSSLLVTGTLYVNYGAVAYFTHENHELRLLINPAYPIYSYVRFLTRNDDKPSEARASLEASFDPMHAARAKPTLLVFVMGETARADRFSFNGYGRDTNRYTRVRNVINFADVSACGTSTADSVPCVFSDLDQARFTRARFASKESLFLALERLGVDVAWRDNSTGCKDVCDPGHFEELAGYQHPDYCGDLVCVDEVLLTGIDALIDDDTRDHFIVFHQRGSHGPAYYTDAPEWSKEFLPECELPSLRNCSVEQINNAYDNTILYTDYFLARVIDLLEAEEDRYDVAMIYVSDHGESLGEKGLFLHGLPYSIAPEEQTKVPMLFWASPAFYSENRLDVGCIRKSASLATSHDSLFHTVLPLFDIKSPAYDASLDLFSSCRSPGRSDPGQRVLSRAAAMLSPGF